VPLETVANVGQSRARIAEQDAVRAGLALGVQRPPHWLYRGAEPLSVERPLSLVRARQRKGHTGGPGTLANQWTGRVAAEIDRRPGTCGLAAVFQTLFS
jgi:hypothetical protein